MAAAQRGGLLILVAVGSAYGAYLLAPQTIVQPLFLVGEMVGPALIGLYAFGERDTLARCDQAYFAIGVAGGFLVALSFSFQSQGRGTNSPGPMPPPHNNARAALGVLVVRLRPGSCGRGL